MNNIFLKKITRKLTLIKVSSLFVLLSIFFMSIGGVYAADDLGMSALKLTTNPDGSQEIGRAHV